jgi:hypothetical protein
VFRPFAAGAAMRNYNDFAQRVPVLQNI